MATTKQTKPKKEDKRTKLRKEAKALGLTDYSKLGASALEALIERTKNPPERVKQIMLAAVTIEDINGVVIQVMREGEVTKLQNASNWDCGEVLSYSTKALLEALELITEHDTLLTHEAASEKVDIHSIINITAEDEEDLHLLQLYRTEEHIAAEALNLELEFAVDDVKQIIDALQAEYKVLKQREFEALESKLP